MKNIKKVLRRPLYALAAVAVLVAAIAPTVVRGQASAAQVQTRSIEMSNSVKSASGVQYKVIFTPQTSGAQSLVVDFCDSAIIGAACTSPPGMSFGSATLDATTGLGLNGWTMPAITGTTVKLTKGTGSALTTSAVDFTVKGVVNPNGSVNKTFYARIYTYSDTTYGGTTTAYTGPTSIGDDKDYGGFALSVTEEIQVTATVMEQITFCVSKSTGVTVPGDGCTGTTAPALTLGHGSPPVLDSTAVDTDFAATQISTNALHGAVVSMKNTSSTTCAGLSSDNGANCDIPAVTGSLASISAGTAAFGLHVDDGTNGTTPVGSTSANANYGSGAGYTMQAATFGTYGDPIFDTNGTVCANINNILTFAATAAPTTPAAVYKANESLIATGTF